MTEREREIARGLEAFIEAPMNDRDRNNLRVELAYDLELQHMPASTPAPVNAVAMEIERTFGNLGQRLANDRANREVLGSKLLAYGVPFLDDLVGGILPHDVILLGADSGVGKTQLAMSIAANAARAKKRVHLFALEAEPNEIERRILYRVLYRMAREANLDMPRYFDWYIGRTSPELRRLEYVAAERARVELATLRTYYKQGDFDLKDIERLFRGIRDQTDLIILDHFHYLDMESGKNENQAAKDALKAIRATALEIGKPVILVAHLRKRDRSIKQLMPGLEDFHGSSDITKIATQSIMIARAPRNENDTRTGPISRTLIHVPKERRSGATGLVGLLEFDMAAGDYRAGYQLGLARGDKWAPIEGDVPRWAQGHRTISTGVLGS